jgi:hypothetical protein
LDVGDVLSTLFDQQRTFIASMPTRWVKMNRAWRTRRRNRQMGAQDPAF